MVFIANVFYSLNLRCKCLYYLSTIFASYCYIISDYLELCCLIILIKEMLKQREFNLIQQSLLSLKDANTKYKPNTLIINHFIIKYNLHGHPAQSPWSSVTFHNFIVFQCYSLYFITLLARYTEVKYHLKQSFFHEY